MIVVAVIANVKKTERKKINNKLKRNTPNRSLAQVNEDEKKKLTHFS